MITCQEGAEPEFLLGFGRNARPWAELTALYPPDPGGPEGGGGGASLGGGGGADPEPGGGDC